LNNIPLTCFCQDLLATQSNVSLELWVGIENKGYIMQTKPIYRLIHDDVTLDIENEYNRVIEEIKEFFNEEWQQGTKPIVCLVSSKKEYNMILQENTPDYLVGNVNGSTIYIVDPNTIEKETNGVHKKKDFVKLLKHEMMHVYTTFYSQFSFTPAWLMEGIAVHFAQQHKIEVGFDKEKILNNMFHFNGDFYSESGNFVKYLDEKYGREKLKKIIKNSWQAKDIESFKKIFYEVYEEEI
jgi:hypothetical protein